MEPGKLNVKIFSPLKVFFEGTAVSVTAVNKTGPFDVLLDHINFFSILSSGDVVVNTGEDKVTIPIDKGVIRVSNNVVTVFTNI